MNERTRLKMHAVYFNVAIQDWLTAVHPVLQLFN